MATFPTNARRVDAAETPLLVGVLGRGDIVIEGRGIVDVLGCITVEVL